VNILTTTLAVNATSSAVTGAGLLVGAGPLSEWLGIPTLVSVIVAWGLLIFAFDVARTSRNPETNPVLRVIVADVAWVTGSGMVIFGYPQAMSTEGLWALGLISVAVAVFALFQTVGLRRMEMARSAVAMERTPGH
jgi:hypothetical protein